MNLPDAARRLLGVLVSMFVVFAVGATISARAQVISEFLAQNNGLLLDEDGDSPDWIEIHNPSTQAVNLLDWSLTDTRTNLVKWMFPSVDLPAGGYLIVFASGKDRRVPGEPLHLNFKLGLEGEYLALVAPGGTNIASAFDPAYPAQLANISYGFGQAGGAQALLSSAAPVRVFVPPDGALGTDWIHRDFDDTGWIAGVNGVGYEDSPAEYSGLIKTDLRPFRNDNTSFYVRFPFLVKNPADFAQWRLMIQYDDGFVAYLNGEEIARRNAPGTLTWNSLATANHPDAEALIPEEFDLTSVQDLIVSGTNVLAIQALNRTLGNSDLLILPVISAQPLAVTAPVSAYFAQPTPGKMNVGGVQVLGPLIRQADHSPNQPAAGEPLLVRALVEPAFDPIASVTLHYRVMFGAEEAIQMWDDGAHQDGPAGDGWFAATIPTGNANAGEMVRYYITATGGNGESSRLPLFLEPLDSSEYLGTAMADPSIESHLPVVHWFAENPSQADTPTGTRCSVFYQGEFYDNVLFSLRGQSSSGFPKKGYNIDFPRDHRFRYATNSARVKDIKMLTNWGDKARVRNALAYEMIHEAGSVGHFAFQVRVQRNAQFHAILDMMEDADDRWLERVGLNPDGALYKVYNSLNGAGGSEKKTRKNEDFSDLQALIDNLSESRPLAARVAYAYDNINLPQTISYFVGLALVSSQDHGHKNFYVYRDTDRSGEWTIFPWDVDLSWGRNWTDSAGYFTDTLYQNNVLNFYNFAQQNKPSNRLYNLIFNHPDFRRMYLRRLRTVMDTVLQAPGTPTSTLKIEARIREMMDAMDPPEVGSSDADLDFSAWGSWGNRNPMRAEAERIINLHLPGRRTFLYQNEAAVLNGEPIPSSQPTNATASFGAIDFNPASANQDEEFVELLNLNDYALDVSGWSVTGGIKFTIRPGTVIPAMGKLFLARNTPAFRARATGPRGGQGLFVPGNYDGQLSARGETISISDPAGRLVATTNYLGNPTPAQQFLRITELMYHPAAPVQSGPFSEEDFEFIELKNTGPSNLSLAGVRFTRGVTFSFDEGSVDSLAAGEHVLIASNPAALQSRYGPDLNIAGSFVGALDNAGEVLRLQDGLGEVVFEFAYSPEWQPSTDGLGASLEAVDLTASPGVAGYWRARQGGSPGTDSTQSPSILSATAIDGQLVLTFQAEPGEEITIFHRLDLGAGIWETLETITAASSGQVRYTRPIPLEGRSHFYRVGGVAKSKNPL